MNWKEFLKQLIILAASTIFTIIADKYPNFPLDQTQWISFIIWVFSVMGLINGFRFSIFKLTKTVD